MIRFSCDQGASRHHILQRLFSLLLPRDHIEVLEIGSYVGQSALMWSGLIATHCPAGGGVLCVDPWRPYITPEDVGAGSIYGVMDAALRDGSAFEEFKHHAAGADPRAPVSYLRGTLREVVPTIVGRLFDLVYIDGSHYYDAVREDLLAAQVFVRDGGLLCGDDLEKQLSAENTVEWCRENRNRDYVDLCHPGVTLAVGEIFGRVWAENGIWGIRRRTVGFENLETVP